MKTEHFSHDIVGLESLANELGYKESTLNFFMTKGNKVIDLQSVLNFLEDNPGAVEAVFEWAEEYCEDSLQEDDEDDWCEHCDHENDDCMCRNDEE